MSGPFARIPGSRRISPGLRLSALSIGARVRVWQAAKRAARADRRRSIPGLIASLSPEICLRASLMDWTHRDPFDRILATTAEITAMALISADAVFDGLPSVHRIW